MGLPGCSMVNKQYYYTTSAPHTTIAGERYYKVMYNKFDVAGPTGTPVGSITTSNGYGRPLFGGPLYVPFIPVGLVTMFIKNETRFSLDIKVKSNDGYFAALNLDSARYKIISDSLNALRIMTAVRLNTVNCYMIINGSEKVPLHVKAYFYGNKQVCGYRMFADIGFSKVRTFTIVTGNPLLDSTFKNVTFKRHKRLTYNLKSTL